MRIIVEIYYSTDADFGVLLADEECDDQISLKREYRNLEQAVYFLGNLKKAIFGRDFVIKKVKRDINRVLVKLANAKVGERITEYFDYGNQTADYKITLLPDPTFVKVADGVIEGKRVLYLSTISREEAIACAKNDCYSDSVLVLTPAQIQAFFLANPAWKTNAEAELQKMTP